MRSSPIRAARWSSTSTCASPEIGPPMRAARCQSTAARRKPFGCCTAGPRWCSQRRWQCRRVTCVDLDRFHCVGLGDQRQSPAHSSGCVTGTGAPVHLSRRSRVWEIRIEDESHHLPADRLGGRWRGDRAGRRSRRMIGRSLACCPWCSIRRRQLGWSAGAAARTGRSSRAWPRRPQATAPAATPAGHGAVHRDTRHVAAPEAGQAEQPGDGRLRDHREAAGE